MGRGCSKDVVCRDDISVVAVVAVNDVGTMNRSSRGPIVLRVDNKRLAMFGSIVVLT